MNPEEPQPAAPRAARFFKSTEAVFLLALAVFGLSSAWRAADNANGIDFYQFWVVGQSLDRPDISNVYSETNRARLGGEFLERARHGGSKQLAAAEYRQTLETYSTPFLYAAFRFFSTGDYGKDFRNYRCLTLVCLLFGLVVLARLDGYSWNMVLAAVAVFTAGFGPFTSDIRVGNVNSLELAVLAAWLWVSGRTRWRRSDEIGGAILGLAVAFKPNLIFIPAVLAVHWIFQGRTRRLRPHALGAVFGLIIAFFASAAYSGSVACWADWAAALRSIPGGIITVDLGNFAPGRILGEWLGMEVGWPLAVVFAALAVVGLWLIRPKADAQTAPPPQDDAASEMPALAIGCLLVVLLPKLAWFHYYVLAIPAFLWLLRPVQADFRCLRLGLVLLALLVVGLNPVLNVTSSLSATAQGAMVAAGAVMVFLLLVIPPHGANPPR